MEKKGKILLIDSVSQDMHNALEMIGFECIEKKIDYMQLISEAALYSGYIVRNRLPIDKKLLSASTQLKFVARIGAGMEKIDTQYATQLGIACIHTAEGNADAVAEHVIASLLMLMRNLKKADTEVRLGEWLRESNKGFEITGKTVGIIGYGNMGKKLAQKLSAFGCEIVAYDRYKPHFGDIYAQESDLKTLQQKADIVSVHINYLPDNHYFINKNLLSGFAKNIYLVNTSRGQVLSVKDVIDCISSGKVKGAVLDVLEYEDEHLQNLPKEKWDENMQNLAKSDKIILTPHIAGQTFESFEKHTKILIEKLLQLPFMQTKN
ncbi:MAG: hypothetical protein LBR36_02735 [Bacteroidales bacterium]|jgi:D-3-phosphoglycerate dehydrogenase|nr:hypothetical protein [Bacteroidales bacterium]